MVAVPVEVPLNPGTVNDGLLSSYPLDPAMTTWKLALYWPWLVKAADSKATPQKLHLMAVVLGGSMHPTAGLMVGSLSKKMLKDWQPVAAKQSAAHWFGS